MTIKKCCSPFNANTLYTHTNKSYKKVATKKKLLTAINSKQNYKIATVSTTAAAVVIVLKCYQIYEKF